MMALKYLWAAWGNVCCRLRKRARQRKLRRQFEEWCERDRSAAAVDARRREREEDLAKRGISTPQLAAAMQRFRDDVRTEELATYPVRRASRKEALNRGRRRVMEVAARRELKRITPTSAELSELAKRYPVPQEWYDE